MNRPTEENGHRSFADLPMVLTVEEAAAVLRISRSAAYRLIPSPGRAPQPGQLPALRLGRKIRIPRDSLARVLAGEDVSDVAPGMGE